MSKWIHISRPTPEVPKCDFCSQEAVVTCFVSTDAAIGMEGDKAVVMEPGTPPVKKVILDSSAHWAACEPCAFFIRAKDHEGLRQRSFQHAPPEIADSPTGEVTLELIQESMFWLGFTGVEHDPTVHKAGGMD